MSTLNGSLAVVSAMVLVLSLILVMGSCSLLTDPADASTLQSIQDDAIALQQRWDAGTLTSAEFRAGLDSMQAKVQLLQGKGYSIWEILGGILGSIALGAFGLQTGKGVNVLAALKGLGAKK